MVVFVYVNVSAMPLCFLEDERLYSDCSYCLSRFSANDRQVRSTPPLIFHSFWSGALTTHHELSLKSLLVTQSAPYEVWVWMPPEDLERNRAFIASLDAATPPLRWRAYRPEEEARDTPFEGLGTLTGDGGPLTLANALRLLVLGKYGGVYFDLDVLFLRDLRPLCNVDFFYQWSNQPYGNNAVFYAARESSNIWKLVKRSATIGTCRPRHLLAFPEMRDLVDGLHVLPVFLFDPVWIARDTGIPLNSYCNQFRDFFSSEVDITLERFFPGAYTYHWHNYWDTPIRREALAGQLLQEIEGRFNGKYSVKA